jgi:hypothetical protein
MYKAGCRKVKAILADVRAACVMLDGWTDKHKARPYVAVRVSFVKIGNFMYSHCHEVVQHHTGEALADYVQKVISKFFTDPQKLFLATCHDGAANVMKASRIMKS